MERPKLLRRALRLELATLGWNVVGCLILAVAATAAGSVALAGFGIDSLIEILASTVAMWQLRGTDTTARTVPALRIIAVGSPAWRSTSPCNQQSCSPAPTGPADRSPARPGCSDRGDDVLARLWQSRHRPPAEQPRAANRSAHHTDRRSACDRGPGRRSPECCDRLVVGRSPRSARLVFYGAREARHAWLESRQPEHA
jgi:hypothetical protein